MSVDLKGGIDYALVKRHYDADDYVSLVSAGVTLLNGIPFTTTPDYYVSGLMASLNDPTVIDVLKGWCNYTHGQRTAPAFLLPFLAALGITTWPVAIPAFEAKWTELYSDQDVWVQFEGLNRVRHFIPANTYRRYNRRWFIIWVTQAGANPGTLRIDIEG